MKTTAKERIEHLKGFIEDDSWETHTAALSRVKRGSYRQLRIFYLAAKGFIDNRCLLQASALTYTTLLSLVPLLALMFSILKGLGVQNTLAPISSTPDRSKLYPEYHTFLLRRRFGSAPLSSSAFTNSR